MPTHRCRTYFPTVVIAVLALAGEATAQLPRGDVAGSGDGPHFKAGWQTPGAIQQPKGTWQTPGEIQQPKETWQTPGEIQVPGDSPAVGSSDTACERRVTVAADALFDFDSFEVRSDAAEALMAVGPEIAAAGKHPMVVEGHSDSKGSDTYNFRLSAQRARAVRDWLSAHGYIPDDTAIEAFGKTKPIAPNHTADGRDNPEGRQKNRRVEIAISICE